MAGFTLRAAREADQARIVHLVRQARINPLGLDWRRFVVAVNAGEEVVGCGQIKRHNDGSRELASIVVDESWRGRGIARALITRLMRGAELPLWLTCRSSLVPLYEKFGFEEADLSRDPSVPPYFRRLARLAVPFQLLAGQGDHLAIMVARQAEAGT